jgi:hypothetical protein
MENGIYVTFLTANEPANRELPPVGPLDQVVVRQNALIAERRGITQAEDLGVAIERWLEAELELQRALGQEVGPPKRDERRFVARDGILLRFVAFGDAYERGVVPELGPFAVVHVTPRSVEADGTTLATRASGDTAAWTLDAACGNEFAGLNKTDIALRTSTGAYHHAVARVTPAPTLTASAPTSFAPEPPAAPQPQPPAAPQLEPEISAPSEPHVFVERSRPRTTEVYSAYAAASTPVPQVTGDSAVLDLERERLAAESLRARIQDEERRRIDGDDARTTSEAAPPIRFSPGPGGPTVPTSVDEGGGLEWGAALWRTRFLIIGVLLLLVGGYYFFAIRNGGTASPGGQVTHVAVAQKFSSARWDYQVNGVQRVTTAGTAQARGEFYIVRVAATNKGTENLQLSPADFTLYDANGDDYRPSSITSGPYQTSDNPQSPYPWPKEFPIGRAVTFSVIFDVTALPARGNELTVSDAPTTRVRLD